MGNCLKLLGKYLYFEIELDNKKYYVRRIFDDNELRWENCGTTGSSIKWVKCDETFRVELRPSTLESDYSDYMRTQKLERIIK
jgi:hypothetical protein